MVDHVCDLSADMLGHIALNKRVHFACHCVECRKDAWIRSCYKDDGFSRVARGRSRSTV